MKKNKLKQLTVTAAAVAGVQFALPAVAADSTNAPAPAEVPAYTANGSGGNAAEEEEIKALKEEVQLLSKKIDALEQQQHQQSSATQTAQIQDLDQKVRILARQHEIDQDTAAEVAKAQPKIYLGQNGFSFSSADSNFVATLHALVQVDSRTFIDDHGVAGNDSFLLRRARPIFAGTVFRDFDYNFTPDFGGSTVQIQDAFVNYHYNSPLQLQIGKFKSPVGLEQLQPDQYTLFNERSLATDLTPNRDIGAELHGDVSGGLFSYAAGIFDGASDNNGTTFNSDTDDNKAFAGRAFTQPFKTTGIAALTGFGVGVGGSYEYVTHGSANGLNPSYLTDGQQKFFTYGSTVVGDGTRWRISPQTYYYWGPLSLMGEYVLEHQRLALGNAAAKPFQNDAWDVTGGWVLTGEDASYTGVTPRHPFDLHHGGWGAWQIAARYAQLNVDNDIFTDGFAAKGSSQDANAWSVGLNWYLNRNVRFNLSYSHTTFSLYKDQSTAITAQPENVIFTRVQLAF